MTWFRKGKWSRLSAQRKKIAYDQTSVCVQWEYREWKYQKMNEVGGLAYRFSGVQSSSQEQSSWGNYNREKRVCTVSVNQRATNGQKQDELQAYIANKTAGFAITHRNCLVCESFQL